MIYEEKNTIINHKQIISNFMNAINNSRIHAEIRISSSTIETASVITNTLKLRPSATLDSCEFLERKEEKNIYATKTQWKLKSTQSSKKPLQEHIQELIHIVEKKSEAFQDLIKDCQISIHCTCYSDREQGIYFFDHATIKKLHKIPLNLGIFVYYAFYEPSS